MKTLFLYLVLVGLAIGEPLNTTYSYKSYPTNGLSFKSVDASEFNGTEIRGTCFYQEWLEGEADIVKDIFPTGMTGVIFINCNLDNILIPAGNTVVGGTNRKIKVQNDLLDWELNSSLEPVEPMDKEDRILSGVSIDPADIPVTKLTETQRQTLDNQRDAVKNP